MAQADTSPHIAVIGAGIVGASLAWHLARGGAQVTVVDEGNPAKRATHGSFAWINAHQPGDEPYFSLRLQSMRLWQEMAEALPGLPVRFDGTLNWEDDPDRIEEVQRALNDGGNAARLVSRQTIAEIEPNLANPPEVAIDAMAEGAANPNRIAEFLLFAALSEGAVLRTNTEVLGLTFEGGRVTGVEVPEGVIEADEVIVAAGTGTAALLAEVGFTLPMDNAPGLLIRTPPVPKVSRRVLTSMALHVWQKDDGSLLVGEDFGGTDPSEGVEKIEARVMGKLDGYFTGLGPLTSVGSTVMRRPKPADGYPALGRVPGVEGLWAATTHSGVTLAPVIGALLSKEILSGKMEKALHPYRIKRFGDAT